MQKFEVCFTEGRRPRAKAYIGVSHFKEHRFYVMAHDAHDAEAKGRAELRSGHRYTTTLGPFRFVSALLSRFQ